MSGAMKQLAARQRVAGGETELDESFPSQGANTAIEDATTDLNWDQIHFGASTNEIVVDTNGRAHGTAGADSQTVRTLAWCVSPLASSDHFATNLDPGFVGGSNSQKSCAPAVRMSIDGGVVNGYFMQWGTAGPAEIIRVDDNALTSVASGERIGGAWHRLEAQGDTIRIVTDGGEVVSITDSTHSGTLVGFVSLSDQSAYVGAWEAGTL